MPKIAIVLTNGYADWECAFLNGIGAAYYGIETVNVAPGALPIVSQGGLQTLPDANLSDITPDGFDALVICGSAIWDSKDAPDIKQLATRFLAADKYVAGICGGTLALANAGLLNDKKHTSNAPEYLATTAKGYTGTAHYINKTTAIEDHKVVTAPGNAPAHFSAAIFRALGLDEKTIAEFLGMLSAEHAQAVA
jgi:putative intracellular protease/amidase